MRRFWADMYLAQFYDDANRVGMHPSIGIDSGYLIASQGAKPYNLVGETGMPAADCRQKAPHISLLSGNPCLCGLARPILG